MKTVTRANHKTPEVQSDIRDRLDTLLRLKGFSMSKASRLMGVSDITLSKFFRGTPLSYMALIRIEDFLIRYGTAEVHRSLSELKELGLNTDELEKFFEQTVKE